jgi:hypothetical protein
VRAKQSDSDAADKLPWPIRAILALGVLLLIGQIVGLAYFAWLYLN